MAHFDDKEDINAVTVEQTSNSDRTSNDNSTDEAVQPKSKLHTRKALFAWCLLCFSTGPTASVAFTYVTAALQTMANVLGHVPGSNKPCAKRGAIKCVVRFGAGEIDYNSYVLYLQAIGRACEGILTIFLSGIADYAHYRKTLMIISIVIFGAFALPFASFSERTYHNMVTASVLFCAMTSIQGAYGTMEASYIPLFMKQEGWFTARPRISEDGTLQVGEQQTRKAFFNRGAKVSVLGLVSSNVGSITALLIGVIILYTVGNGAFDGYKNFLLAITIAGCITIVIGIAGWLILPSVPGGKPPSKNFIGLALKRWIQLIKSVRQYPEAFKLCVGWILWNTGYSNFNSVVGLLFREVTGLGSGDRLYTVWTFTAILTATIGSLTWMFVFPKTNIKIKHFAYAFLSVNFLCVLWGAIGISKHVTIGYKHAPEFWIEQALFSSTSSALRSANRVMYSSMLPKGREAQFFGLELTLDLATGWINPLIQSTIQNRTHNLRFPMIPNILLMTAAICFYVWFDLDKGITDSLQPFKGEEEEQEQEQQQQEKEQVKA